MCNGSEGSKRMEVGKVSPGLPTAELDLLILFVFRNMRERSGPMFWDGTPVK